jgi:hypothetical protein
MGAATAYMEQKIVAGAGSAMKSAGGPVILGELAQNPATRDAIGTAAARGGTLATEGVRAMGTMAEKINEAVRTYTDPTQLAARIKEIEHDAGVPNT